MGTCSPSSTRNHFSHHPFTCTEGTERTKSELGEHCLSSTPQERTRVRFPSSVDRISVNRPPPLGGNDAKRALQGCLRDSLPPVIAVDEEARNPPVGRSLIQFAVPAHSAWELHWWSELTPTNNIRTVIDEGRVGLIRSNKLLFQRPVLSSPLFLLATLEVEGDAPAATPDSIVFFDHPLEVGPCRRSELTDRESCGGPFPVLPIRPRVALRAHTRCS